MKREAIVQYDLSASAGWAIYSPTRVAPRHGILKLPKPDAPGELGPALELLWEHIAWVDRNFGLCAIGFEAFIAPTGGQSDKGKRFVTSPATTLALAGYMAVIRLSAQIMGIPAYPVQQSSWKRFWLGAQPVGTKRVTWKALSVARARDMGWAPLGDDDADALGQLHWLLNKLGIDPPWKTDRSSLFEIDKPEGPLNG